MWQLREPKPVKLIIGILAADSSCQSAAVEHIETEFGTIDLQSDVWPFSQTEYYKDEIGPNVLRQFVTIEKPIDPGDLAQIKHKTNEMEQQLAGRLNLTWPRPVNLDPGIIEPSKLVLASTKNFSHRIYIGNRMYAEVTLNFSKGIWKSFEYTFPDYKQSVYHDFFSKVRSRLLEQLREQCT
ncbi:MAG: DUF4416 family protein [Phycisphaerae bacterium]|jgi:hypothetical protein